MIIDVRSEESIYITINGVVYYIDDSTGEQIMKKWKEKTFAAGVDRGIIERGAEELGVELTEHIDTVIKAMQGISEKLGL